MAWQQNVNDAYWRFVVWPPVVRRLPTTVVADLKRRSA